MDWTTIITALIGGVFGTALGAFLTFKLGNRKQDESEFSVLVNQYKDLVEEYKVEVVELRKDVNSLRNSLNEKDKEVIELRNQLMIFESSHVDVPLPIWLKDINGIMLFVNSEYEKALLHPINKTSEDYIGSKDVDIWGDEIGKRFLQHDRKVMREKKAIEFEETWKGASGEIWHGTVVKYPRFLNRRVIGIGGIVTSRWKDGSKKN